MKTHFTNVYVISISFIAGVLFIISCGGGGSSIAAAVTKALSVVFDNADSAIESKNVEGALKELERRFPLVIDDDGKAIGSLSFNDDEAGWNMWDFSLQAFVRVDPITGSFVDNCNGEGCSNSKLFFKNSDCSGTAYLVLFDGYGGDMQMKIEKVNSKYYAANTYGSSLRGSASELAASIGSYKTDGSNTCNAYSGIDENLSPYQAVRANAVITTTDLSYTLIQAREVTFPTYSAPLHLGFE